MTQKFFLGGVPTKPDVDKLTRTIDIKAGAEISYERVEQVTGLSRTDHRFRTVTQAWRKHLFRNSGLQSSAQANTFYFLSAEEALKFGTRGLYRAGRAIARIHIGASAIDERQLETDHSRQKLGMLVRESQALLEQSRRSTKTIAGPAPVRSELRLAK